MCLSSTYASASVFSVLSSRCLNPTLCFSYIYFYCMLFDFVRLFPNICLPVCVCFLFFFFFFIILSYFAYYYRPSIFHIPHSALRNYCYHATPHSVSKFLRIFPCNIPASSCALLLLPSLVTLGESPGGV